MKFGLIGLGKMGQRYISNINKLEGSEISWLCSRRSEDCYEFEKPPNYKYTQNWQEVVESDVDAIILANHPENRMEMAKAAIAAYKGVVAEKPLTMIAEDALELLELTNKYKKPFLVNFTNLWQPAFKQLKEYKQYNNKESTLLIKNQGLGPFRNYSSGIDYGCHAVSLSLSHFDKLENIKINKIWNERGGRNYDYELEFNNGICKIQVGNGHETRENSFEYRNSKMDLSWKDGFLVKTNPLKLMLEDFIENGGNNLKLSFETSKIIERIEQNL